MNTEPVYQVRGVTKEYDNVLALDGVDFAVAAGEVVGLVGDNGAGKSTLVKVLSGAHRPDQGEMLLDGALVQWHSLQEALESGIETLYQDSSLAPWEVLDTEISGHEKLLTELPAQVAPDLVKAFAVGPDTASEMLIVAGDNPERIRSEAAFARLCGVAPDPCIVRDDHPTPTQPWRSQTSERGALPRRHRSYAAPRTHQ